MKSIKPSQRISNYTIMHIEKDDNSREFISELFSGSCKKLYSYSNSDDGIKFYNKYKPDFLLLAINIESLNGIEIAKLIRENDKKTRIIVLTKNSSNKFILAAVELDVTRYLIKPANRDTLFMAFEKAIDELESNNIVNLGNGNIYSRKLVAIINNNDITPLRKKEAEILEYFIEYHGEVLHYNRLENNIWNDEVMSRDAIRSQIRNIRKKIGNDCLENINGIGYKFTIIT